MTVRDFLKKTMILSGVLSTGENMSAAEESDGIDSFNDLLESWSTQGLLIYQTVRETFNLVPSQAAYTIGVGGNFNTSNPMIIQQAGIIQAGSNPELEIPMVILNVQEWAGILQKQLDSEFPASIYFQKNAPLSTINFYPVPNLANKVALYSLKPLSSFSNLSDTINLPQGYKRALRYNLALEFCVEYGREPSVLVAETAKSTKADLMRVNMNPLYLESDAQFLNSRNKAFNYLTGE